MSADGGSINSGLPQTQRPPPIRAWKITNRGGGLVWPLSDMRAERLCCGTESVPRSAVCSVHMRWASRCNPPPHAIGRTRPRWRVRLALSGAPFAEGRGSRRQSTAAVRRRSARRCRTVDMQIGLWSRVVWLSQTDNGNASSSRGYPCGRKRLGSQQLSSKKTATRRVDGAGRSVRGNVPEAGQGYA